MVIEGNILIGEVTPVSVSYTAPIDTPKEGPEAPASKVWVEDESGRIFDGNQVPWSDDNVKLNRFEVDTRAADPSLRHRLHVLNKETGKEYVSSWERVGKAASIDSLSYSVETEKGQINIALSMHSEGESYFKWSYEEDWEYHSEVYSYLDYVTPVRDTPSWNNGYGIMQDRPADKNIYFCWGHDVSDEIMVFSTESQVEDRFVDLEFHKIARTDRKISILYRMNVALEAIPEEAYTYWTNVKTNSEYNGSLFAPNPSEMSGNIRCVNDTTEMVIGYISAAQRSFKGIYVRPPMGFYKGQPRRDEDYVDLRGQSWPVYYKNDFLPIDYPNPESNAVVTWAPSRCVDCRKMGGTKNKPADWPSKNM